MPASSVIAGGTRTRRPGASSTINASALARKGPGIKKLVLIGTAEGGVPGSVLTDGLPTFLSATGQPRVDALFRSGDLLAAGRAAFDASRDRDIPSAPAQVLFYKVNPATRGSLTLQNAQGDVLTAWSRDYGLFVNRCNIQVYQGTNRGLAVVIALESVVEAGDDIGGLPMFTARYETAGDYETARLVVDGSGTRITFTDQLAASVVAAAHDSGEKAVIVSANAYDTVQKVTVYGVTAAGAPVSEELALNGVSAVTGTQAFGAITAVRINGATRGAVTIADESAHNAFVVAATLTASHVDGELAEILSSSADDIGQVVTVYGYTSGGQPQQEAIVLNGTTAVAGLKAFGKITAAQLSAECAGNITVRSDASNAVAFTIAAGDRSAGLRVGKGVYLPYKGAVDGALQLKHAAAPAGAPYVVIRGRSKAGEAVAEKLTLTDSFAAMTAELATLEQIELGMGEAANAVDWKGNAIDCPRAGFPYVQQVVDAISSKPGFHAAATADGAATFAQSRLDYADQSIRGANDVDFMADLDALVLWVNANSSLVTFTRAAGASGPPTNMNAPSYLVGGSEGTALASHWQAAYNALKGRKDVIVVPCTTNAAVHAMQVAHNRYMEGKGRDERNGYVGLDLSLSKTALKAAIRALNDRNTSAVAQKPTVFDRDGIATQYDTWLLAVIAAAMQAGSPIAEPLTNKTLNVLSLAQHTGWSPSEDADEMIELGLMFARLDDERGILWERSITTYRDDDNPVFTEMSTNESANESTRLCRRNVEAQIGQRGFAGRADVIRSLVIAELQRQIGDGTIKAFDAESVDVGDEGDTFPVSYNVAPIEPVNFIPITAYMRRIPAAA